MNTELGYSPDPDDLLGDSKSPLDSDVFSGFNPLGELVPNTDILDPRMLSRRNFVRLTLAACGSLIGLAAGLPIGKGSSNWVEPMIAPTPTMPDISYRQIPPSSDIERLLSEHPNSHYLRVHIVERLQWEQIDWEEKRDHWDPIPLQGIDDATGNPWIVAVDPIQIVTGETFQVQDRACPDEQGGNYHPSFQGELIEVWNIGTNGEDAHGYDPEYRYIFANQVFCVNK